MPDFDEEVEEAPAADEEEINLPIRRRRRRSLQEFMQLGGYEITSNTGEISITPEFVAAFDRALQSEELSKNSIESLYGELKRLIIYHPENAPQVFQLFEHVLQSDKNTYTSLYHLYGDLHDIIEEKPEFAPQAFKMFEQALQSDKNMGESISAAYSNLKKIIKEKPEFASQAFKLFEQALQSDKNKEKSISEVYYNLRQIIEEKPEFTPQALQLFEQALQSDKNSYDSVQSANTALMNISKENPKLIHQVLKLYSQILNKNHSISNETLENLHKLSEQFPAWKAQISAISMVDFSIRSFDDFKKYIEEQENFNFESLDDITLSRNDLKSITFKNIAVPASENSDLGEEKLCRNLIWALQFCGTFSQKSFWAQQAAKLQNPEKVATILSPNIQDTEIFYLAINNPIVASKFINMRISRRMRSIRINSDLCLILLKYTSEIKEHAVPILKEILRPSVFNAYIAHKEQIDKMPRKRTFLNVLQERAINKEANFFDAFTEKLRAIAAEPQFAGDRYYENLSDSLKKDEKGFRARAEELFTQMLKEKDKYATSQANNEDNFYIRKIFPELAERWAKDNPISEDDIQYAISRAHKTHKVAKEVYADEDLKKENSSLLDDILEANPDNISQVRTAVELFYSLNVRPIRTLMPLIKRKKEMPDWMIPIVINAYQIGVISLERLGGEKDLFDACKTWKVYAPIDKKNAVAIGKMQLPWRLVAIGAYKKVQRDLGTSAPLPKDKHELYWQEFAYAQKMGINEAVKTYVDNRRSNRKRLLGLMYGNRFTSDEMQMLTYNTSIATVDELNVSAFQRATNVLLELEWQRLGYGDKISDFYRKNREKIEELSQEGSEGNLYVQDKRGNNIDFIRQKIKNSLIS